MRKRVGLAKYAHKKRGKYFADLWFPFEYMVTYTLTNYTNQNLFTGSHVQIIHKTFRCTVYTHSEEQLEGKVEEDVVDEFEV